MHRLTAALVLFGCTLAARAATFTVTNTDSAGAGTLRQAILDANGTPGNDNIAFAIPGVGVHTIELLSALPPITQPVILDGYTQPGSSPNTLPASQGLNTVLTIEIRRGGNQPCLTITAGNDELFAMAVYGLAINGCSPAILVGAGGDGVSIAGNFIGTDPTGTFLPGDPTSIGIQTAANSVQIGGSTPFERNLISGFTRAAIDDAGSAGTTVRGNLIGTNAAGDATIPMTSGLDSDGVWIRGSLAMIGGPSSEDQNTISGFFRGVHLEQGMAIVQGNRIGTDATGTLSLGNEWGVRLGDNTSAQIVGNVISGNDIGIFGGSADISARGNFIGTDLSATLDVGNSTWGINLVSSTGSIGGEADEDGNVIAYNGSEADDISAGVVLFSSFVSIRRNRIFANGRIGIDLEGDGVTPNDGQDGDTGANGLQNFPILSSVVRNPGSTHIEGLLRTGLGSYVLDFFGTDCRARPASPLQAEVYLGSLEVTTDGLVETFSADFDVELAPGQLVTATATDSQDRTSELSQGALLALDPPAGPPSGGLASTLHGMDFEAGATVSVGGVPATNVIQTNLWILTATMPALPAGSLNTVIVTNPDGTTGTLPNGWIANFLDVPGGHLFYDSVIQVVASGISGGIGGGLYGVANPTLRQQMAVFLLKARYGICFVPPPCQGIFADVPCPSLYADWIEALSAEGITGGCGPSQYCPGNPVRRDQMAPFLLKAKHGADYVPSPCTGLFDDVACPSLFADWIEQLNLELITGGCGGNNYCPLNNVTRGQMAVFVTKSFNLP